MFGEQADIVGIDFSGASDAGTHIWIAECQKQNDDLTLDECYSLRENIGTSDREEALSSLAAGIAGARECTVGLDFPFSVPADISRADTWEDAIAWIADHEGPIPFHEACKARSSGGGYQMRATESKDGVGGLCSYGWRIKSQTFYGVSDVISPLLNEDGVQFPHRGDPPKSVNVVETYPAATLATIEGAERTGYKAKRQDAHERRFDNVDALGEIVEFSDGLSKYLAADDNALDSVVAALAAHRAVEDDFDTAETWDDPVEGYIYV